MKPVKLVPKVLQWARERAGLGISILAQRMKVTAKQVQEWEQTGEISVSKAKKLASIARTPFGYLFLAEPLSDALPIPDFRTVSDRPLSRPSPDLLETIHTMQLRQEWMRDFLIEEGAAILPFVNKFTVSGLPIDIAQDMRDTLGITTNWADEQRTWEEALSHLRQKVEEAGILIFINGVVGNNTHRKLNTQEFRGFALCDGYAPLIFINNADWMSAKMFTVAHELAHIWLGKDGVSNIGAREYSDRDDERFCNSIAAEFLVPSKLLNTLWPQVKTNTDPYQLIARHFKVSPIVAARRCRDLNLINRETFFSFYDAYINQEKKKEKDKKANKKKQGGDFWNTQNVRIGVRFGTAVVIAAKEGRLLFRDAYRLTGLSGSSFETYSNSIGLPIA